MAVNDRITELTLKAQERIFRLAARDHGLSLHAVSLDSGIPYNTVRSYAGHNGAQAMMPVSALLKLAGVIPDHLLSQVFDPVGKAIVDCTTDDGDHDALAANCIDLASHVQRARSPNSPAGVEIADCEDRTIRTARAQLKARA